VSTQPAGSLRLLTITGLWRMPRALHNLGTIRFTWTGPISYRLIGYTGAVFGTSWLAFHLLHVPQLGNGMTLRWLIPGAIVWWALRVAAGGGRALELAWSWAVTAALIAAAGITHLALLGGRRPVRVQSRVTLWGSRPELTEDELDDLLTPSPVARARAAASARTTAAVGVVGTTWATWTATAGQAAAAAVTTARGLVPTVTWRRDEELSEEDLDALMAAPHPTH
jgi:hypothetical protein